MKYKALHKTFLLIAIALVYFNACEKDTVQIKSSSITLYDKPLFFIQAYIKGKWKLQYSYGGESVMKIVDKNNSYLYLSPNHITIGNDSLGIIVNTTINWVKNDFTYLLSYKWAGFPWPEYKIVEQIKNDTLVIRDDMSDGFKHYYTKY